MSGARAGQVEDRNATEITTSSRRSPRINSIKTIGATKWLALETIQYTDVEDNPRQWDMATRTTKQAGTPDAVVVIPLLRRSTEPTSTTETVVVEQFRIPVRTQTVEFPAGLIDSGESAEEAAVRELKEETGYIGHSAKAFGSRELCMTPGMVNETIKAVVVHVDLDDPRNQHPISSPDDGEILIARRVPLSLGLTTMMENGSNMPISLLYFFALGFELGSSIGVDSAAAVRSPKPPVGASNVSHAEAQIPAGTTTSESSNAEEQEDCPIV